MRRSSVLLSFVFLAGCGGGEVAAADPATFCEVFDTDPNDDPETMRDMAAVMKNAPAEMKANGKVMADMLNEMADSDNPDEVFADAMNAGSTEASAAIAIGNYCEDLE